MSNERKNSGLGHEFNYTPVKEEEGYTSEQKLPSLNSRNFQVLPGIVSPPFEAIDQAQTNTNNKTDESNRPPPPKTAFMCFSKAIKGVSSSCALWVTFNLVPKHMI